MIYLNNAATSYPKPQSVIDAITRSLNNPPAEAGRGAAHGDDEIQLCRRTLAAFFGARDENEVIFTSGATHALNLAISGFVNPGDHVVTSVIEHNSVLRPLRRLERDHHVRLTVLPCTPEGFVESEQVARALRTPTALVALSACSNVTGAVQPVARIVEIARTAGAATLIDAAQSAGDTPFDFQTTGADMAAIAGHKGLLGPAGVGALLLHRNRELKPLMTGGTGVRSQDPLHPIERPLAYEAGTPNTSGIAGLRVGIEFIQTTAHTMPTARQNAAILYQELKNITGLKMYGPGPGPYQAGIISLSLRGITAADLGYVLQESYEIIARAGLHCAPLIHRAISAPSDGTLRLSPSRFTTSRELETVCKAFHEIAAAL